MKVIFCNFFSIVTGEKKKNEVWLNECFECCGMSFKSAKVDVFTTQHQFPIKNNYRMVGIWMNWVDFAINFSKPPAGLLRSTSLFMLVVLNASVTASHLIL